jgi:pimeloyl-ACP methyl ester carboxylesterase
MKLIPHARCALIVCALLPLAIAKAAPAETSIEAPGPAGALKGVMLTAGAAPAPLALIIPGSGPTDSDGNNPLGVRASTYKLLAQDLAGRGVATVRIDKRGMFASAAAVADPNAVTIEDYVADVHAWAGALRQRTGAPCIWLIGHSEGGLVAMAAAAKDAPGICGQVLIAAAGRPLGVVLRDQFKANPANAPLLGQAMAAIDSLEQGRRVNTAQLHPALQGMFAPQVQGFLMSVFSYDPGRLLGGYRKPVLVLQGQRDIQVSEADARRLKQAAPQATLVLLPDVNHVLKSVASSDVRANLATYADPALPLAPGVGSAIAEFIVRNSKPD